MKQMFRVYKISFKDLFSALTLLEDKFLRKLGKAKVLLTISETTSIVWEEKLIKYQCMWFQTCNSYILILFTLEFSLIFTIFNLAGWKQIQSYPNLNRITDIHTTFTLFLQLMYVDYLLKISIPSCNSWKQWNK